MAALLEIENLSRYFGGLAAVDDVSFSVNEGEIAGLIGPNGSGKTTCFNVITGYLKRTSGNVRFAGESISRRRPDEICRRGLVRTFQISSVFPDISVRSNVLTALHPQLRAGLLAGVFGLGQTRAEEHQARERVEELLEFVNLTHRADSRASVLGMGEQRRLMIAAALATGPRMLMLDEPSAGMDDDERAHLMDLIRKVRDSGTTVLVVEHHMRLIMNLCDRVFALNFGKKIAEGTPAEIQNHEQVLEAYLGVEGKKGA